MTCSQLTHTCYSLGTVLTWAGLGCVIGAVVAFFDLRRQAR